MKGAPIRNFHLTMEIIEDAVILPDIIYLFKLQKSPKTLFKYGGKRVAAISGHFNLIIEIKEFMVWTTIFYNKNKRYTGEITLVK